MKEETSRFLALVTGCESEGGEKDKIGEERSFGQGLSKVWTKGFL